MRVALLSLCLSLAAAPAIACGAETDCVVGDRSYRIALPEGHDGSTIVPVVAFAHGYQGSAAGVMRNGSLRRMVSDLGAALIAFNAEDGSWNLPNHPRDRDSDGSREFAYVDAVLDDAAARFALDSDRIMATGFSGGGMLVWNLVCARSGSFAGFAPIAGTYWLEPPEVCDMPVASVLHIHGNADKTVPLDGRAIGDTKQGEVDEALAMYRAFGGFGPPQRTDNDAGLVCDESTNPKGDLLSFCLFEGGHSFRTEHLRYAWDRLKRAGKL